MAGAQQNTSRTNGAVTMEFRHDESRGEQHSLLFPRDSFRPGASLSGFPGRLP